MMVMVMMMVKKKKKKVAVSEDGRVFFTSDEIEKF